MNYWERRQSDTLEKILKKADASADEIANIYAKSSFYLNSKIEGIFDRYRSKYGLSIQEAKVLLNQLDDITSYEEMIKILKNSNGKEKQELLKHLDSPAYRYRIERLQNVQKSIDDVMQNIYNQEKKISTLNYIDVAHDSYFRTVFNMQKNLGYEFNFSNINPKYIDTLLHANWSGKNYSERIWSNTKELSKQIKEELLIGILTGKSERDMQKEISEKFQVGNYKARRLIQTESAYMSTMMDLQAYKEVDIDIVKFVAMHDLKTSKICQRHDGKYIKIKDTVVGSNIPPLHPNCRSFIVPVIDEELDKNLKRRIKDKNGQYRIVDANETYDGWLKEQETQDKDSVEMLKKKIFNFTNDKEQYYRYREVLGNEFIPDSLDKFQKIKYNDVDRWDDIKKKYRVVNQYENHTNIKMPSKKILDLDQQAFNVKRKQFSSDFKKAGNIGIMELDGEIYYAHSRANLITDKAFVNFKGDRKKLILKPEEKTFETKIIGTHDRDVDSEYKLFEFAAKIVRDGKEHELFILSELQSCESCKSVANQFKDRYPNVKVSMVSTKESRMKRKYDEKEMEGLRNRWKRK